jgi:hypothetical protein
LFLAGLYYIQNRANTLAYLPGASVTKETSFTTFSAVVHQIVHLEEGRVLLQDMVLRFQAVQVRPGSQASHRKEKERKKLFYFLIECVLSFFLEEIRLSVSILFWGVSAATTYFDRHSIENKGFLPWDSGITRVIGDSVNRRFDELVIQ